MGIFFCEYDLKKQQHVISTEAADSLTVRSEVERPRICSFVLSSQHRSNRVPHPRDCLTVAGWGIERSETVK